MTDTRRQWTITPSITPPPSTSLQQTHHHPDYHTVLHHLIQEYHQHHHHHNDRYRTNYGSIEDDSGYYDDMSLQPPPPQDERMPLSLSMQSSVSSRMPCNELQKQTLSVPVPHELQGTHSHFENTSLPQSHYNIALNSQNSKGGHRESHCSTLKNDTSSSTLQLDRRESVKISNNVPILEQYKNIEAKNDRCCELIQTQLKPRPDGSIMLISKTASETTARNSGGGSALPERLDVMKKTTHTKEYSPYHDNFILNDVRNMGSGELSNTAALLSSVKECGMALIFNNESSQLREQKSKFTKATIKIDGVSVAVPIASRTQRDDDDDNFPSLKFIFIPLDASNQSLDDWSQKQLLHLLSHAKVICYGAQEIVTTILNHFELHSHTDVWLKWQLLDIKIGTWLLDPDNVPDNFHQTLSRFNVPLLSPTTSDQQVCFDSLVCQDLSQLGPLMIRLYHQLIEHGLWDLFSVLETKLIPILGFMEAAGVKVNTEKLLHFDELLKLKISHVESSAHKAANRAFSINSTMQLRQVLFDELQLDKMCSKKLSKTQILKHKSTSEAVLNQLQGFHPLPGLVLEYRQLCKMKATYITGLFPFITKGVLHPCWQHTGAATGRLVSCSPNIQAFPKQAIQLGAVKKQFVVGKEDENHSVEIREAIVSRDGYSFVATDFRSIELRLLAHLSNDPALITILTTQPQNDTSHDVFTHLAAQWLSVSVDKVLTRDRERAKRVVYAIVYGVGKEKLAEILDMNSTAAKELMTSFLKRFSQVQIFMHRVVTETRDRGYAKTICHRKRWFPHIKSANPHLRSYSERQAINFPIQGSAADICKCGMIQIVQMLTNVSPSTRLLLQIHDELLFEVPDEHIDLVSSKVKALLESTDLIPSCELKVPLEVRVSIGKNWASLTPHQ